MAAAALSRTQPASVSLPPSSHHTPLASGPLVTRLMRPASSTFPFSETVKLMVIPLTVAAQLGTQACAAAGVTPSASSPALSATSTSAAYTSAASITAASITAASTTAAPVATFSGAAALLGYSWTLVGVGGFAA